MLSPPPSWHPAKGIPGVHPRAGSLAVPGARCALALGLPCGAHGLPCGARVPSAGRLLLDAGGPTLGLAPDQSHCPSTRNLRLVVRVGLGAEDDPPSAVWVPPDPGLLACAWAHPGAAELSSLGVKASG